MAKPHSHWWSLASRWLLAAGIVLAALAALLPPAPPDCEDPDSVCSVFGAGERRARDHEIEVIGGKTLLMAVRFQAWAGTWLHGPRLMALLAAVSFVLAAFCRRIARSLLDEERDAAREFDEMLGRLRERQTDEP